MGERLTYDQLITALSCLSACAVGVTLFTEWMLQAIERRRAELEEREYWLKRWQFRDSRHLEQ